ncbi:hypothetical protein LCGC14_2796670 [marine sediment metagenome]|uniref:H-type lectin domain-containing protein n=1 Tax=marine sediment metagenome TaxID=412755 RepID=A0A0F8ZAZ7_9ZZZZ
MSKSSELRDIFRRFLQIDNEVYQLGNKHSRGTESAIEENTTRDVTFEVPFLVVPAVVVSFADNSAEHSMLSCYSPTTTGFTIRVDRFGAGQAVARDVSWIATTSGNP